jgi:hypothetical protein
MRARQLAEEWALPVDPNPPRDADEMPDEDEPGDELLLALEREKKE